MKHYRMSAEEFEDRMTLKAAVETAGKVSYETSKMPGSSFAISARECQVGGKLAKVFGSVCSQCYAQKIQKSRPSVDQEWTRNYLQATDMIGRRPEAWARAAAFQIKRIAKTSGQPYHRWFDAGDLQSVDMLAAICRVAELTPEISHWLSTRETRIVDDFLSMGGVVPENLVIRVSAAMIGDGPVAGYAHTSTVHTRNAKAVGHVCPASAQGNACGSCRACWNPEVHNVSYPLH